MHFGTWARTRCCCRDLLVPSTTVGTCQAAAVELAEGLYESVVTAGLRDRLSKCQLEAITDGVAEVEVPAVLANHVAGVVAAALATLAPTEQVEVVNRILDLLPAGDRVEPGPEQLLAVRRPVAPGVWRIDGRPSIPLGQPALLTNARGEPSLAAELVRRSTAATPSTCSARSSSGTACGCSSSRCAGCGSGIDRYGS